jgi:hypothetical protein
VDAEAQLLHSRSVFARLAAKLTLQPAGSAAGRAPLLHAGEVFDSLEGFRQALQQEQERCNSKLVLHKRYINRENRAYICRETRKAILQEGIASATDDHGARDKQWWRHVCAGACGFVAEVRQATHTQGRATALGTVMQAHIRDKPLAAAEGVVGINGVRQDQWVVTLFAPHTCKAATAGAVAAPAATPASVAASAAADLSVCPEASQATKDYLPAMESGTEPAAAMLTTLVADVDASGSCRNALAAGQAVEQNFNAGGRADEAWSRGLVERR